MKSGILKAGRFCSSIVMESIPLFMAYGLIAVMFSQNGWFPNEAMAQAGDYLYNMGIPLLTGFCAGKRAGGTMGGMAAVIACTGIVTGYSTLGIVGAAAAGALTGFLCRKLEKWMSECTASGFEMITKNLVNALLGCVAAALLHFFIMPFLETVLSGACMLFTRMAYRGFMPLVSLLIEPAKVFFLNNSIHHGILVPAGMSQTAMEGSSVLFLIETNPGPGLGILLAMVLAGKLTGREGAFQMAVESLGGIHEVYFPYILSDMRLLPAVMAGGAAGTACFMWLGAGAAAPVSPGSVIMIFLMCGRGHYAGTLAGIAVSAAVSCITAVLIIKNSEKREKSITDKQCCERRRAVREVTDMTRAADVMRMPDVAQVADVMTVVRKIYFVCDAGMGSSAMAAALFRRKINSDSSGIFSGITVAAAAWDQIPADADVIVCQKNMAGRLENMGNTGRHVHIFGIDNLVNTGAYEEVTDWLKKVKK